MATVYLVCFIVGNVLEIAAVALLLRQDWRKYFFLLAYLVVTFLTGIMDMSAWAMKFRYDEFSARLYWVDDTVRNLFLLLLVFSLVWKYADDTRAHTLSRRLWPASGLLIALIFYIHAGGAFDTYMSLVSRDFNAAASVLVLLLWAVLISTRSGDRTLLLVTAGLGLMCAGGALGHAVRFLSKHTLALGSMVIVLAYLLGLAVWVKTFWFRQPETRTAAESRTATLT